MSKKGTKFPRLGIHNMQFLTTYFIRIRITPVTMQVMGRHKDMRFYNTFIAKNIFNQIGTNLFGQDG